MQLAVQMAKANMVQGTRRCRCEVGLFTVVKKAEKVSGVRQIDLRLVFDQRFPNKLWRDPPWVPLAGPGAMAAVDLSPFNGEAGASHVYTAAGDIPSYFFCLGIPKWFAQFFVLPQVRA